MKPTHFKLVIPAIGILILALCLSSSCSRNRLKTDEKKLVNQILTEEEQLAQQEARRTEREKQLADSIAKLPKGFQFNEDRKIDQQNPPVVIDIIGSRKNSQKIILSRLFNKVEYIRLEQTQDSTEFTLGLQFIVAPNHIYVKSGKGSIFQFDREGHFIRKVCTGNLQFTSINGGMMVTKEQSELFEGAQGAYWNGVKLCYQYENRPAQKSYLVTFDDEKTQGTSGLQLPETIESQNLMKGSGKILTEIKKNASSTYSSATPYVLRNNILAFAQRRKRVEQTTNFISMVSTNGDTLCKFRDYDPIRNFSKSTYRGVDGGDTYYKDGTLYLRQSFNDTIYQLIPPNRLVPKYILDFGDSGIRSAQEGIDPGVSLKEKLVPQSFLETNRYLFITYSKDYDCPNTAKSGSLKYSRLVYDKESRTLTSIYIDEAPFVPEGKMTWPNAPDFNIENDLDKMPFKWPGSVTAGGLPFSTFSGKELLKQKNPDLPLKNIQKDERIIAIYH
jgi:hypothetical protein